MFIDTFRALPLIAILRGITPDEVEPVGRTLFDAGFRAIEIPLNSPSPLTSIGQLGPALGSECWIGAGTVLTEAEVDEVAAVGGRLVVSPNADTAIIRASRAAGMVSAPGVATPSEAFAALDAGAHALKMFPAEALGPPVVKAWRAVIPAAVPLVPVGGITPDNMAGFVSAGASGFGLGSALYTPGMDVDTVRVNANAFVTAWRDAVV